MTASPKYLSPTQAAELLSVSPRTLEKWRTSGTGPRYIALTKRTIRYSLDALDTFVQARSCASTSHAVAEEARR
jgi:hypothetical protein